MIVGYGSVKPNLKVMQSCVSGLLEGEPDISLIDSLASFITVLHRKIFLKLCTVVTTNPALIQDIFVGEKTERIERTGMLAVIPPTFMLIYLKEKKTDSPN